MYSEYIGTDIQGYYPRVRKYVLSVCMCGWGGVVWSRHRHHIDNLIQHVMGKYARINNSV